MAKTQSIAYVVFAVLAVSMLSACIGTGNKSNIPSGGQGGLGSAIDFADEMTPATQQIIKFKDRSEMVKFLGERLSSSSQGYSTRSSLGRATMTMDTMTATAEMSLAKASPDEGASDFSSTNIQVENVDEADFVKNDDRYIYMIADNRLVIVDAYDAQNARIVSSVRISDSDSYTTENDESRSKASIARAPDYYNAPRAKELFVSGNKLLLFVESNERSFYFQRYDIRPVPAYAQKTYAYIYDITDRSNPRLIESYSLPGSYYQSRMINEIAYIVTQQNVYNGYAIEDPIIRPMSDKSASPIVRPEIYYFDNPEDNYNFNTIASIDLATDSIVDSKTFMLGYANTLMVSEGNIYIAYQKQNFWVRPLFAGSWPGGSAYEKERFTEVILPLLPSDIKSDLDAINSEDLSESEKWQKISERLARFYKDVSDDEGLQERYEDTFGRIQKALDEYDAKKAMEDRKTIIHKISIDAGKIEYHAKGEVFGTLLNQFSMDEHDENLRVATTVDVWIGKRLQHNNVYVLDSGMKTIGKVENIAEDERIYSTRFMGEKLYMVTFRQTDPFFVIDLSDPRNPSIAGELKLPGFSNYLHPYGENHVIGVGKETAESELGGVTTKGIKIALFDVSDMSKPKLVDKFEIGDSGTDSPALHDHRAFLFSKSKNLLVLPVTEVTRREKLDSWRYNNYIWHGVYVFNVTEQGFDEIGKVEHSSTRSEYFDWWSQASVLRSLYMDDNLYTISNKYIKINDIGDNLEELNTVKLPYTENSPYLWR